jgi:hypothetical protein
MAGLNIKICFLFIVILLFAVDSADAQRRDAFGIRAGIYADGSDFFMGGEYLASLGSNA